MTRVRKSEIGRAPSSRQLDRLAARADQGSEGMPVGVQVAGHAWQDPLVLAAMAAIEARVRVGDHFPTVPVDPLSPAAIQ